MPYCSNCGKLLQEGEVCSCTASAQGAPMQQPNNNAPQGGQYNNGGMQPPPPPYPYNGQPYPNQPYPQGYPAPYFGQQLAQPPKKSNAWILAIVIPLGIVALLIIAILAAILVPSMLGYTKKSKQSSMNSNASTLFKVGNTALIELDEEKKDIKGYYIISSDNSRNQAVPFDVEKFREKTANYFNKIGEYEYFMVCRDGAVEYTAIAKSWGDKSDYIGTYPPSNIDGIRLYRVDSSGYTHGSSSFSKDTKMSLSDLYKDASKEYASAK